MTNSTLFVDKQTIITAGWANDVNTATYGSVVNARLNGCAGDGVTDDTIALQGAINLAQTTSSLLFLPAGNYLISGPLFITANNLSIMGSGPYSTIITSNLNTADHFTIGTSLTGLQMYHFQCTKSVTATGGNAINFSQSTARAFVRNIYIQKCYNGMVLGNTDKSDIKDVFVEKCQNIGILMQNLLNSTQGALQWHLDNVTVQYCGAQGFLCQSQAGATNPSQITLGTWKKLYTFSNTGVGIGITGSVTTPIQGIRLSESFFGNDGNHEIYLDTHGDQHIIANCFSELAGTGTTGPNNTTVASNTGSGITITANNGIQTITNVHANGNSLDGFSLNGTGNCLSNCEGTNNGLAAASGDTYGVNNLGGYLCVTGGNFSNIGGSTSQTYGVFGADGSKISLQGALFLSNTSAAWGATSNAALIQSSGNLPNTLTVQLSGGGGALIGNATGGASTGSLNVSGNVAKNNTNYTNP